MRMPITFGFAVLANAINKDIFNNPFVIILLFIYLVILGTMDIVEFFNNIGDNNVKTNTKL